MIVGEAFVAVRPLTTGFAAELRSQMKSAIPADAFGGLAASSGLARERIIKDAETEQLRIGSAFDRASTAAGNSLTKIGGYAGGLGLPFSNALAGVGTKFKNASAGGEEFGKAVQAAGGLALASTVAAGAGIVAVGVHFGSQMQSATDQIAANENISVNAARNITAQFTDTAGKSIFSGVQMAQAFVPVAGQLRLINGTALNAGQALAFEANAANLAEASGGQLANTTKDLAGLMQSFHVPLSQVTQTTNELYNASRVTGTGVDQLTSTMERLHARLGIAAPTIGNLSTALVDLNMHGVVGARGLLVVNTAVNTLLNSAPKVDAAVGKSIASASKSAESAGAALTKANDRLTQEQQRIAATNAAAVDKARTKLQEEQDRIAASSTAGAPTTSQQIALQNAQDALSKAEANAAQLSLSQQQSLANAQAATALATSKNTTAQSALKNALAGQAPQLSATIKGAEALNLTVFDSQGKFVGLGSIFDQLAPKLRGYTEQVQLQKLSTVFGTSANKALLDTVLAGQQGWTQAQNAIDKSTTAEAAAAKQKLSLRRELDVIKASMIDYATKIGLWVIPRLQSMARETANIVSWFGKHKAAAEALAIAIGTVLGGAIAAFTYGKLVSMGKLIQTMISDVGTLASKLLGLGGPKPNIVTPSPASAATGGAATSNVSWNEAVGQLNTAATALNTAAGNLDAAARLLTGSSTALDGSATSIDTKAAAGALATEGAAGKLTLSSTALATDAGAAQLSLDAAATKLGLAGAVQRPSGLIVPPGEASAAEEVAGGVVAGGFLKGLATKANNIKFLGGGALGLGVAAVGSLDLIGHALQKAFPDPTAYGNRLGHAFTPTGFFGDLKKILDNWNAAAKSDAVNAAASGLLKGTPGTHTTEPLSRAFGRGGVVASGQEITTLGKSAIDLANAAAFLQTLRGRVGHETGEKQAIDQNQINQLVIGLSKASPGTAAAEARITPAVQHIHNAASDLSKSAQALLAHAGHHETGIAPGTKEAVDKIKKEQLAADDLAKAAALLKPAADAFAKVQRTGGVAPAGVVNPNAINWKNLTDQIAKATGDAVKADPSAKGAAQLLNTAAVNHLDHLDSQASSAKADRQTGINLNRQTVQHTQRTHQVLEGGPHVKVDSLPARNVKGTFKGKLVVTSG